MGLTNVYLSMHDDFRNEDEIDPNELVDGEIQEEESEEKYF